MPLHLLLRRHPPGLQGEVEGFPFLPEGTPCLCPLFSPCPAQKRGGLWPLLCRKEADSGISQTWVQVLLCLAAAAFLGKSLHLPGPLSAPPTCVRAMGGPPAVARTRQAPESWLSLKIIVPVFTVSPGGARARVAELLPNFPLLALTRLSSKKPVSTVAVPQMGDPAHPRPWKFTGGVDAPRPHPRHPAGGPQRLPAASRAHGPRVDGRHRSP